MGAAEYINVPNPMRNDSADLEPATRTITATSKPLTPDYSVSFPLPLGASPDPRLVLKRVCVALAVTVDSMSAGHLYASVELDGNEVLSDADFDLTQAGEHQRCRDSTDVELFQSLTNFNIYFWVDSGTAVLSMVRLRYGYGFTGKQMQEIFRLEGLHGFFTVCAGVFTFAHPDTDRGTKWRYLHYGEEFEHYRNIHTSQYDFYHRDGLYIAPRDVPILLEASNTVDNVFVNFVHIEIAVYSNLVEAATQNLTPLLIGGLILLGLLGLWTFAKK